LERLEAAEAMYSDNRESLFRWDVAFHDLIAEAAHSPRLRSAMIAVRGELFLPVDQALLEHSTEQVHSHHEAIVAAVRDREPRRAGDEMLAHVEHIRTMVFRAIAESGRS
jgi:DNA-binding FadR family transcriptional regulator